MNTKKGIVVEIKNNSVILLTETGEFAEVKKNNTSVKIGNIYENKIYTKSSFKKYIATAACLIFALFVSTEAYAYYTPTSTILLDGSIKATLEVNKWDKIISIEGDNEKSNEIIEVADIKYNSIEDGIVKILETNKNINKNNASLNITYELTNDNNSDVAEKIQNTVEKNDNKYLKIINTKINTTNKAIKSEENKKNTKTADKLNPNDNEPLNKKNPTSNILGKDKKESIYNYSKENNKDSRKEYKEIDNDITNEKIEESRENKIEKKETKNQIKLDIKNSKTENKLNEQNNTQKSNNVNSNKNPDNKNNSSKENKTK